MFGTVVRIRPKEGMKDRVLDHIERYSRERGSKVKGFRANYAVDVGGGELIGVAVFDDEETYRANANDPEQHKWYEELRANLEADPDWSDGPIRGGAA